MDSGRRSNMSDLTNDEGFFPSLGEESLGDFSRQPSLYSKKKSAKRNAIKNDVADENDENDFSIRDEIVSFLRKFWATRQTEDIDKEAEPNRYVRITLRELFIYVVFLVTVSLLALGMVSPTVWQFQNIINGQFIGGTEGVYQMHDIWTYLQESFMGGFYNNFYETPNDQKLPDSTRYFLNDNRVLGVPRLRQLRVLGNSCSIPKDFSTEIKFCFSNWSPTQEDTQPFGPYAGYNTTTNATAWFYQTDIQLNGLLSVDYVGLENTYGSGGYVQLLSPDSNVTTAIIEDLMANLWIDRATRAVFLDFTIYNANINLFCAVKIAFELPASGGVFVSYQINPVKLLRYVNVMDYVVLVCEAIFVLFLFYYTIEEIIEIRKHKSEYFNSVWSFLDVIIIGMGYVCVGMNIYRQVSVSKKLNSLLDNEDQFISFDFLCYVQTQFNNSIAFIVFLSWIKIFKYTSFNKTMTQLSMTLSRCAADVAGFGVMFLIIFLAFAQLGYLFFGSRVADFATVKQSILTCFRMILGDFDYFAMQDANRILGPVYFLAFVFFVFFILMNMFVAIISDTYAEIKEEMANETSDIELGAFFKKGYEKVLNKLNLKKAQIVDIQKAITTADVNNDQQIDFIEWRNNLRAKGYADIEIETLFAKYDLDGDKILNAEEQKNMMKDLAEQNEELKDAIAELEEQAEEAEEEAPKKKKKVKRVGVAHEDFSQLSSRIDNMESSIASIAGKIDAVLDKFENAEKSKNSQSTQQLKANPPKRVDLSSIIKK